LSSLADALLSGRRARKAAIPPEILAADQNCVSTSSGERLAAERGEAAEAGETLGGAVPKRVRSSSMACLPVRLQRFATCPCPSLLPRFAYRPDLSSVLRCLRKVAGDVQDLCAEEVGQGVEKRDGRQCRPRRGPERPLKSVDDPTVPAGVDYLELVLTGGGLPYEVM
jgi:hypothetical protein